MKTICRGALLAALVIASVPPLMLLVPSALAGSPPASTTKTKKHTKHREHKKQKEVVLKGHHGKHAGRPA